MFEQNRQDFCPTNRFYQTIKDGEGLYAGVDMTRTGKKMKKSLKSVQTIKDMLKFIVMGEKEW